MGGLRCFDWIEFLQLELQHLISYLAMSLQACESEETAARLKVWRTDDDGGRETSGFGIIFDFLWFLMSASSFWRSRTASNARKRSINTIFLRNWRIFMTFLTNFNWFGYWPRRWLIEIIRYMRLLLKFFLAPLTSSLRTFSNEAHPKISSHYITFTS